MIHELIPLSAWRQHERHFRKCLASNTHQIAEADYYTEIENTVAGPPFLFYLELTYAVADCVQVFNQFDDAKIALNRYFLYRLFRSRHE